MKAGFPRLIQQQGDGIRGGIACVAGIVRQDHIDFSVAVHVGKCESERIRWARVRRAGGRMKVRIGGGSRWVNIRSFAALRTGGSRWVLPYFTQQDADVSALEVSGDDVRTAVAIHVGGAQALIWMTAYRVLCARRREAALPVAEDHGDFVVGPALDGYVDVTVAVEIGGGDAVGVRLRRDREWRAR